MATKKKTNAPKTTAATTVTSASFEWGVVIAGAVVAGAISIVLSQFGAAVGLSATEPLSEDLEMARWGLMTIAIWVLWVQLMASMAGGYVAGFMRAPVAGIKAHERETRDGIYGLAVWATGTVVVTVGAALVTAFATATDVASESVNLVDTMTDTDKNIGIIYAFSAGAFSLVSAVAAWWAATMGGAHRDKGTNFSKYLSFK